MIDEKKIEEAAFDLYQNDKLDYVSSESVEGFKLGAHWAIEQFLKDLWHDASEEPRNDYGSVIAYCTPNGQGYSLDMNELMYDGIESNYSVMWNRIVSANKLDKWFYLEDLLTKQKGGSNERT